MTRWLHFNVSPVWPRHKTQLHHPALQGQCRSVSQAHAAGVTSNRRFDSFEYLLMPYSTFSAATGQEAGTVSSDVRLGFVQSSSVLGLCRMLGWLLHNGRTLCKPAQTHPAHSA